MPGTLMRRLIVVLGTAVAAGAIAAACAPTAQPSQVPVGVTGQLITHVPDSVYDSGRSPSVAVDKAGDPVVAYLMYKPVLKKGQIPPVIVAGQPQPPAVMLATQAQGVWSRISVTKQSAAPAKGDAPEIANDNGQAKSGVAVALALSSSDKHFVAWSTPDGLFYATDATGAFDPKKIGAAPASGVSIAVGPDGAPWISYYKSNDVVAGHPAGGTWTFDTVATVTQGGLLPARTAIRVDPDGNPVVAFTDPGAKTPMLARNKGGAWTTEPIEKGGGGWAISMDVDKDGNPHVAYYTSSNTVHHAHSIAGAPWTVSTVGGFSTNGTQDVSLWSTGIALDDKGTHYVTWADTTAHRVLLANNAGGSFATQQVPGANGGGSPGVDVSSDGKHLALAWFNSTNADLNVATTRAGGLTLAFSPPPTAATAAPTSAGPACKPDGTKLSISAPNGAAGAGFDKKCLAAPAGTAFSIDFKNDDTQIHNVAIYTADPLADPAAKLLGGAKSAADVVQPGASTTYQVDPLDAGLYFFHCDIHPTTMTGQFVVVK